MLLARLARSARPAAVRRFADAPITQAALPRTIPDEALDFEMRMYVHAGRKLPVPDAHMISEYKVKLRVKVEDLGLDDLGAARLAYLTGPRFDAARGVLEDGMSSCPRAANIWREFVQFEGRHRGEEAAEAARRRARAALGG